ncbi:hypothetical protein EVAR_24309_1 [Eumeta japonica]|uniref:Uncharacterized protein n=1 Tax=Eumeta variegata TaxID=151549 RepID=A0A4C1VL07_EUMVA|nr:hypothetical protein EVAR_24309_1 [Eumeta japonica]
MPRCPRCGIHKQSRAGSIPCRSAATDEVLKVPIYWEATDNGQPTGRFGGFLVHENRTHPTHAEACTREEKQPEVRPYAAIAEIAVTRKIREFSRMNIEEIPYCQSTKRLLVIAKSEEKSKSTHIQNWNREHRTGIEIETGKINVTRQNDWIGVRVSLATAPLERREPAGGPRAPHDGPRRDCAAGTAAAPSTEANVPAGAACQRAAKQVNAANVFLAELH